MGESDGPSTALRGPSLWGVQNRRVQGTGAGRGTVVAQGFFLG